jgi:hypothetical protein
MPPIAVPGGSLRLPFVTQPGRMRSIKVHLIRKVIAAMLFDFELAPLAACMSVTHPANPELSWFRLTQGEYWITVGDNTLLEYVEAARTAGAPLHCCYPVARLHEDILNMLPCILEPVPAALVQYLAGDNAAAWWETYETWYDRSLDAGPDARLQQMDDDAHGLLYGRLLDTSYLAPLTSIAIWSDDENVYFTWDNRAGVLNGIRAWSAQHGEFQMPRREFLAEVQSFNNRLLEQMADRIERVRCGALPPDIAVDLDALLSEHAERGDALHDALSLRVQTDWPAVERAISHIREALPGA